MNEYQSDQNQNPPGSPPPGQPPYGQPPSPPPPQQPQQPIQPPQPAQPIIKKTNRKVFQITDYIFWLIEGVILVRFALKLIIADPTQGGTIPGNPFVMFMYNLTNGPVQIFRGIAADLTTGVNGVFEISALIAMLVIWLFYLAIVKLLQISTS